MEKKKDMDMAKKMAMKMMSQKGMDKMMKGNMPKKETKGK